MSRLVAIVGRPNVGKSTLFNRLTESKRAIVHDESGVTRDRQYEYGNWSGTEFLLVDTGGYVLHSDDVFEKEIRKQVNFAIDEADIILFMVDVEAGLTGLDESFANHLRKVKKPVLIVANKSDNNAKRALHVEFYQLGFSLIFPVSAINGSGTGELLDKIVEIIKSIGPTAIESREGLPRFTVIGKPNVGKSTFVNALLGEERNIVSEIPGTTRDSIDSYYNKFGKEFIIVDTAGLRKKNKIYADIEFYSTVRAVKAIEESDVCFLIIDAVEGIQKQDLSIVSVVEKRNKGLVILLNKWDMLSGESDVSAKYKSELKQKLEPFNDVPVISVSALNKTRIMKAVEAGLQVYENKNRKISTSQLNEVMQKAIADFHPPAIKGRMIRIKYVTQLAASYPLFAFFCNHPQYVKEPYKRYLENKLRANFNFEGTPLKIIFKQK